MEVFPFGFVDCLVIDGGQGVQLFLPSVEFRHGFFVLQCTQLFQIGVHRVESVDGDTVIRIGVRPRMRHGGVVDGQNLYGFLLGTYCPVNHAFQVAEVAYAEALLGTEREYGYGNACAFPGGKVEIYVAVADDNRLVCTCLRLRHIAVRVVFPANGTAFFLIIQNEFIFQREADFGGIYLYLPFREIGVAHKHGFVRIPVSEHRLVSADAQTVVAVDAGGIRLYQQSLLVAFGCRAAFAVCQERFRKGGSIEILLFRQVFPAILYPVDFLGGAGKVKCAGQAVPLCACRPAVAEDIVAVLDKSVFRQCDADFRSPVNTVYGL